MTTETDHLALLAKKTVTACSCTVRGCSHTAWCLGCKGSGRVLDPRFEKLRNRCHEGAGSHLRHGKDCPGYTVVRDLGVLLEIMLPQGSVCFREEHEEYHARYHLWGTRGTGINGRGSTSLEAAAQALYDWVEAQEQEVTG